MASIIELVLVFLVSLGVNSIPFASPSNLFIPAWFPNLLVNADTPTLVIVGLLVALGAAFAKSGHYMITFFISGRLSEKRRARLDADAAKVKRWAFFLLFAAAASPIPDEPVVVPLGLMKYSPARFFGAYFSGKLLIALLGAFLAGAIETSVSGWLSQEALIISSIVLTVAITIILLKVDLGKLADRILRRKPTEEAPEEQEKA